MTNHHLYTVNLDSRNISHHQAIISRLKDYIREGEADSVVNKYFPLRNCGNLNEKLRIKGTASLFEGFEQIDCKKLDIKEKIKNIELVGFDDRQLILRFLKDGINGIGVYRFTLDFLDELFSMGKFSTFCFEQNYVDILRSAIEALMLKRKDKRKQYRLVQKENTWFLRGLTSVNRYNNYDNHLAIYLTLHSLHRYAKEKNIYFSIEKAYMTQKFLFLLNKKQPH